jgi:hypothetical protein
VLAQAKKRYGWHAAAGNDNTGNKYTAEVLTGRRTTKRRGRRKVEGGGRELERASFEHGIRLILASGLERIAGA